MYIKLQQHKLLDVLEKLSLDGLFTLSTVSIQKGSSGAYLVSTQKLPSSQAIRYVKFNNQWFEDIKAGDKGISFDISRLISIIKNIGSEEMVEISLKKDKINVVAGNINASLTYREPEAVHKTCPVKDKDDIKIYGRKQTPLDTKLMLPIDELKECVASAKAISTEFFRFETLEEKLAIRVGNLSNVEDYITIDTKAKVVGKEVNSVYTIGIKEISKTFSTKNITVFLASDKPAWFYEKDANYEIGVLLAPFVEDR